MSDVQVIGLTRFSYPSAPGAFGKADLEDLRARLYAEARMALRFFWFEQVALPAIRGQTDSDFTHILMVGDQLPGQHRDRLERLTADLPQVRIVALEEGQVHRLACRDVMRAARDKSARAVAEFRLDDDDGVGRGFVADLKRRFTQMAPLFEGADRFALDYCRGLLLRAAGQEVELRPVMARLWTPALAVYRRPEEDRSLLDAMHLDIWKQMPVLSLRHPSMFVRGAHEDNASAISRRFDKVAIKSPDMDKALTRLSKDFGVDLDRFDAGLRALRRSC